MTSALPREIPVDIILPTKWWKPTLYRIHHAITVGDVQVPARFVSDGASVPRIFWMVFPPIGLYFYAALVHDYLLKTGVSWRVANRHFRRALRNSRVPRWRQHTMVAAVCVWGVLKTNYLAVINREN